MKMNSSRLKAKQVGAWIDATLSLVSAAVLHYWNSSIVVWFVPHPTFFIFAGLVIPY
jgi:hypothetical protein